MTVLSLSLSLFPSPPSFSLHCQYVCPVCWILSRHNVRGVNGTIKKKDVVNVFRKGKFKLLALNETKLKGDGKVSWYGVNGIISCIQEMERAREGVAILLNDV